MQYLPISALLWEKVEQIDRGKETTIYLFVEYSEFTVLFRHLKGTGGLYPLPAITVDRGMRGAERPPCRPPSRARAYQRPFQTGSRFSAKALNPSMLSSLP